MKFLYWLIGHNWVRSILMEKLYPIGGVQFYICSRCGTSGAN